MEKDSPVLIDDLRTDELGKKGDTPSNIASHRQDQIGDVEKGFQAAHVIVEREFFTSMVHQGYIEPHSATAQYNPDGQITIWCSTQGAFGVRTQTAEILEIPFSTIRVVPMEIGGGFGGKVGVYLEPVAVLLSHKSGHRPVKMTMSRSDVLAQPAPPVHTSKLKWAPMRKVGSPPPRPPWHTRAGAFPARQWRGDGRDLRAVSISRTDWSTATMCLSINRAPLPTVPPANRMQPLPAKPS
jgi:CO/xanthine dehydrogenase Mo-binding subunit